MNSIPHDQSNAFSDWLDAFVSGTARDSIAPTPEAEERSLRNAAERFHRLNDAWSREALPTTPSATTWEALMAANAHAIPTRTAVSPPTVTRHWERANRFVSVALVLALLVGMGAGSWYLANRETGNPGTPPAGMPGLAQAGDATPDQQVAPAASPPATTPIEELPGIQSAVLRMYGLQNGLPSIPDLFSVGVGIYAFDSPQNAAVSYGLIVQTQQAEFATQAQMNPGQTVSVTSVSEIGERADIVTLNFDLVEGYQVQQYLFTLHENHVFAVMTVSGGPWGSEGTPPAIDQASAAAADLATALIEYGQPSPDAARFYEDGTSTGGDWGIMPAAGDPLLLGLEPIGDQQLFPSTPGFTDASASYPPEAADLTGIVGAVAREYASAGFLPTGDGGYATGATPMTEEFRNTE